MEVKSFRDLAIWKRGIELVKRVYQITGPFPKSEIYGLTSQIRRCAVSIPSNIAEGFARSGGTEYRQFLYIAHGSLAELATQMVIAERLGYLSKQASDEIVDEAGQVSKMTMSLIKRVNESLS